MENENTQILVEQRKVTQDAIELPLTVEEKLRLAELERQYEEIDAVEQQIPFIKGRILDAIRKGKLYRSTHKTFAEYALNRFGISRAYAQNLAQIGEFMRIAEESIGDGQKFKISINTANALIRNTNKMTGKLGIGDVEYGEIKPIIKNIITLITDNAPKDKTGNVKITPRYIDFFNEIVDKHLTADISKSKEEVISRVASQIITKSEIIKLKVANYHENKFLPLSSEAEKNINTKWRSAELLAKEYLESLENVLKVEDVSESNLGYDLEVAFKDNRTIYVEVKKVFSFNDSFKLTNNEFANASKYAEDYYVALVIHNPFQINFISNPVAELEHKKVIEQISWKFGDYSNNLQKDF